MPGDSLLYVAGLIAVTSDLLPPLPVVMVGCFFAALLGSQCGYWIGRKAGPNIFNRPDSRFFKQEFVDQSQAYFDKRGPIAVTFARFIPIVRAFAPVIAGVSKMDYRKYVLYDVLGAFLWVGIVTSLGAALGNRFPKIADYLDVAILVIVLLSLIPVGLEYRKHRAEKAAAALGAPVVPDLTQDAIGD
jgi:membrane-associated protein